MCPGLKHLVISGCILVAKGNISNVMKHVKCCADKLFDKIIVHLVRHFGVKTFFRQYKIHNYRKDHGQSLGIVGT